jgi:hypothetical protein
MAGNPRGRKPDKPSSGEHIVLRGPGPYVMPDLIACERAERGRWANSAVIYASTYQDRHLAIPLLNQAATSLIAASPKVVRFETLAAGRQIGMPETGKTLEVPPLERFVCFRAITADWIMAEFLTRKAQRVLVPFSSSAYKQVVNHLKALVSTKD